MLDEAKQSIEPDDYEFPEGLLDANGIWYSAPFARHELAAKWLVKKLYEKLDLPYNGAEGMVGEYGKDYDDQMLAEAWARKNDCLTFLVQERGWLLFHKPVASWSYMIEYPKIWDTSHRRATDAQRQAIDRLIEKHDLVAEDINGYWAVMGI